MFFYITCKKKLPDGGWIAHSVRATALQFFMPVFFCPWGQGQVLPCGTHRTDTAPTVAIAVVAVVRVHVARIEVEAPRAARDARDERTRPVVAAAAGVAE